MNPGSKEAIEKCEDCMAYHNLGTEHRCPPLMKLLTYEYKKRNAIIDLTKEGLEGFY